jgi:hypothetical protein
MHVPAGVDRAAGVRCDRLVLRSALADRPWLWLAVAGAVLVLLGVTFVEVQRRRSEDDRVREATLARCTERIRDEAECRRLIDEGHDDCAVYARTFATRLQSRKSILDPDTYLECVLATPAAWANQRASDRNRQRADHQRDLSGH